jgi:hypothetical protein
MSTTFTSEYHLLSRKEFKLIKLEKMVSKQALPALTSTHMIATTKHLSYLKMQLLKLELTLLKENMLLSELMQMLNPTIRLILKDTTLKDPRISLMDL